MKFKNLIENTDTPTNFNKFVRDCKPFIEENRDMLSSEFYLMRSASEKSNILTKLKPRTRKRIKGRGILFYMFESMRGSEVPSRKDTIPCTGGDEVSWRFQIGSTYGVFPTGSDYKMVYTKGIEDFNENQMWENFDCEDPYKVYNRLYYTLGTLTSDQETYEMLSKMTGFFNDTIRGKKPDHIMMAYKKFINHITQNKEDLYDRKEFFSVYEELKCCIKYMKKFLSKTNVTTKLKNSMDQVEVGLYAPNGFYYVKRGYLNKIDWSSM